MAKRELLEEHWGKGKKQLGHNSLLWLLHTTTPATSWSSMMKKKAADWLYSIFTSPPCILPLFPFNSKAIERVQDSSKWMRSWLTDGFQLWNYENEGERLWWKLRERRDQKRRTFSLGFCSMLRLLTLLPSSSLLQASGFKGSKGELYSIQYFKI